MDAGGLLASPRGSELFGGRDARTGPVLEWMCWILAWGGMDILEHFVRALQVRIGFQVQLTPQTLYLPPRVDDWRSEPRGPFLGAPPPSSRSRPHVLLGECDGACRGPASWNFLHGNMVFLSLVSLDGWGHEQWGEALYSGPAGCSGGCARSRRARGYRIFTNNQVLILAKVTTTRPFLLSFEGGSSDKGNSGQTRSCRSQVSLCDEKME